MIGDIINFPTDHVSDSGRHEFVRQCAEAAQAVSVAIERVSATSPNERDDYSQGDVAIQLVILQHDSRLSRLRSVYQELCSIAEALQRQS